MTVRIANPDASLQAVVVRQTVLLYADEPVPAPDRPRHVRAGSSLARVPGGVVVVQDDANFLAIVDPLGRVTAVALPSGPDGRSVFDDQHGNKSQKLDLEACVAVESPSGTVLLVFGSGSSPLRSRIALVEWSEAGGPAAAKLIGADALYDELAQCREFAGPKLNIEGVLRVGDRLRLFSRGVGRGLTAGGPLNATCDLDLGSLLEYLRAPASRPPPSPTAIVQYALGSIAGVPLGFTDATHWCGHVLYTASAEDTADAVADGVVTGSAIGLIEDGATRWCRLTNQDGSNYAAKVEGLVASETSAAQVVVVVDPDDPDSPSVLCDVELRGRWLSVDSQ